MRRFMCLILLGQGFGAPENLHKFTTSQIWKGPSPGVCQKLVPKPWVLLADGLRAQVKTLEENRATVSLFP